MEVHAPINISHGKYLPSRGYHPQALAMSTVPSTTSLMLDLPPSCIAFCPFRPQLFVIGTYFLHPREQGNQDESKPEDTVDENTAEVDSAPASRENPHSDQEQKRTGSLILFRIDQDNKM